MRASVQAVVAMAGLAILAWGAPVKGVLPASARHHSQDRVDKFWQRALKEVYRSPGELQAQHDREVRKGLFYDKLFHGDPHLKEVALTFDDGPHPLYTPQLLEVLKRFKVKATFFVVGKMAEQSPELVTAEAAAGHEVANHTYHHVNLTRIPNSEIQVEWQACNEVLKSILKKPVRFCRPPGGDYDSDVITAAERSHLTTVLWTDDPGDYASPGDKTIERRTLARIRSGGIILLHDGIQQTIDVLPSIIENLKSRGFKFVTASEMLAHLPKP